QAEWQPCPMELLEKIILHFYNHVSELNLVRMLASRKNNISKSNVYQQNKILIMTKKIIIN
ncbi:Ferric uptake regulator family, partial [Snodgrassella alvi SCGC AB-598-P14]